MEHVDAPKKLARFLYWQGWRYSEIAEHLGLKEVQIRGWKSREGWDNAGRAERVGAALEARLIQLYLKPQKSGAEFKEIDLLGRQLVNVTRAEAYEAGANPDDKIPEQRAARRRGGLRATRKREERRNLLTEEHVEALEAAFRDELFGYQKRWLEARDKYRIRNILKSRQIGATYYFAREALIDAARNGRNKIFLSASRAQANIFRSYIVKMASQVCDVELTGSPIILANGAELHFLGTNAKTAQGYHGDVFLDEYFWVLGFKVFRKVASGMAMHKQWRQTYTSTPSSVAHEAYPFWTGAEWNQKRPTAERREFEVDHAALVNGALGPDGQWRQIVTVEDAIREGCDLFDLEQLRNEYGPSEFRNLLMCEFLDDTLSAFPFELVAGCFVDSWDAWADVKPFAQKPAGEAPVWIGYDPSGASQEGDGAGVTVNLPPAKAGGVHRFLERHRLKGADYDEQADFLLSFLDRYNVEGMEIDGTGIGDAVFKKVEKRFPLARKVVYSAPAKVNLVLQAQGMMKRKRIQFDAGWSDMTQSFISIRGDSTRGGMPTYSGGRNAQTGHGELAWSAMHSLAREPIGAIEGQTMGGGILEIL